MLSLLAMTLSVFPAVAVGLKEITGLVHEKVARAEDVVADPR